MNPQKASQENNLSNLLNRNKKPLTERGKKALRIIGWLAQYSIVMTLILLVKSIVLLVCDTDINSIFALLAIMGSLGFLSISYYSARTVFECIGEDYSRVARKTILIFCVVFCIFLTEVLP